MAPLPPKRAARRSALSEIDRNGSVRGIGPLHRANSRDSRGANWSSSYTGTQ